MTPLPAPLGPARLVAWRLDQKPHAETWDSGEGAFRFGGRWNGKGVRAVYASLDPATAILEVAVHKGFRTLDTVPHVLTAFEITAPDLVRVVHPEDVPNRNWLAPGIPSRGQQDFGDRLLAERGRDEGKRQQDEREERNETGHGGGGWIGAGGSGAGGQSSTLDGWGGLERARSGARW